MLRLTLTLTCPEKQSQKCMNAYYWQTAGWFLSRGAHQGSSRLQNPSTLLWFSQENQSTAHFTQPAEGCTWKCRGFVYEVGRTLHMRSKPNEKHGSGTDTTYTFMGNCCFFFPEYVPERCLCRFSERWLWNIRLFDMKSPTVLFAHRGDTSQHVASVISTTICGMCRGISHGGVAFLRSEWRIGKADTQM